ncbi:hypothetical protein RvY_04936 [Ramazzottius varieornatus]|uniref:Uncharacterized protein n=1 Tax=Ramazzottius varieornatus TaxID=947166 RepID=A0A1D1UTY3_RAMVA|nr:hypothetical protein RvY_04936 [Ramazzottius varieornatus]
MQKWALYATPPNTTGSQGGRERGRFRLLAIAIEPLVKCVRLPLMTVAQVEDGPLKLCRGYSRVQFRSRIRSLSQDFEDKRVFGDDERSPSCTAPPSSENELMYDWGGIVSVHYIPTKRKMGENGQVEGKDEAEAGWDDKAEDLSSNCSLQVIPGNKPGWAPSVVFGRLKNPTANVGN